MNTPHTTPEPRTLNIELLASMGREQPIDCDQMGALDLLLKTRRGSSEGSDDPNWPTREHSLAREISVRRGEPCNEWTPLSGSLILQTAAERYFSLVNSVGATLRGRFSDSEFNVMLNTTCTRVWEWDAHMSVATMVADDNGIEELAELDEGEPTRVLLEKLITLSPAENAALVDACERVWRGYENPLL